jgi:hypothetical protein
MFSFRHRVQTGCGAHPASYPMGTGGSFLGSKAAEREAHHSLPTSVEVKNASSYTSASKYVFMLWCLIKQWIRIHIHSVVLSSAETTLPFYVFLIKGKGKFVPVLN